MEGKREMTDGDKLDRYMIWPDETATLEIAEKTIDNYLNAIKERLATGEKFRIGGLGCGYTGNAKFLRLLVNKILEKKEDITIEILLSDFSDYEVQLKALSKVFPEQNVFIYCSVLDIYVKNPFAHQSMDIIFGYTIFCYTDRNWVGVKDYFSIGYIHGLNYHKEIEEFSRKEWKKMLINLDSQLKKGGLLIICEYGNANKLNEDVKVMDAYFQMGGVALHEAADKYGLKIYGLPNLWRNGEVFSEPIKDGIVEMTVVECSDVFHHDGLVKKAKRLAKTMEERLEIIKITDKRCLTSTITDESYSSDLLTLADKAYEEHWDAIKGEIADDKYVSDIPGVFFCATKN